LTKEKKKELVKAPEKKVAVSVSADSAFAENSKIFCQEQRNSKRDAWIFFVLWKDYQAEGETRAVSYAER
jgi:hypothetical protein